VGLALQEYYIKKTFHTGLLKPYMRAHTLSMRTHAYNMRAHT